MKKTVLIALICVIVLAVGLWFFLHGEPSDTFMIGVTLPLSGDAAPYGKEGLTTPSSIQ